MDDLHPQQLLILKKLLFVTAAPFSKLQSGEISSDHFTFHIKRLLELNLIQKQSSQYTLTQKGKEFANRMDTEIVKIEKQAKLSAKPIVIKKINGQIRFLCQQRLKQPYYGLWGFPGGKIHWGETFESAARRELEEETGLTGTFTFMGLQHKLDVDELENLLEDKVFFVFKVTNPTGELIENPEGGKNVWLTESSIKTLDRFDGVDELISVVLKDKQTFLERNYHYNRQQY